jgi:Ethanolamine utilization protein EutJ (predicted chaperonin)
MDMASKIEILKVAKFTPPPGETSSLKAFVSIQLGSIIIHSVRVVETEGKPPFVALPKREVLQDGEKKFYPIVEIEKRALKTLVSQKVLEAWKAANEDGGEAQDNESEEDPFL